MAANHEKINLGNDIIEKLNVKNAKIIAVCLVIVFSALHGYRHLGKGQMMVYFINKFFEVIGSAFI